MFLKNNYINKVKKSIIAMLLSFTCVYTVSIDNQVYADIKVKEVENEADLYNLTEDSFDLDIKFSKKSTIFSRQISCNFTNNTDYVVICYDLIFEDVSCGIRPVRKRSKIDGTSFSAIFPGDCVNGQSSVYRSTKNKLIGFSVTFMDENLNSITYIYDCKNKTFELEDIIEYKNSLPITVDKETFDVIIQYYDGKKIL